MRPATGMSASAAAKKTHGAGAPSASSARADGMNSSSQFMGRMLVPRTRAACRTLVQFPLENRPVSMASKMKTFWLAAAVLVLAAACSKEAPPPQKPAPQVSILTVAPQTIPYVMTFVAQTESSRQVDIVARISGYLDRIAYREGELVQEGQLLFELDPRPFQAQLDAAKGE